MREAVIVAMGRSPIGKAPKGTMRYTRPEDIGAQVLRGVFNQIPGFDTSMIDDVIVGCAMPEAEQGLNMARNISLKAGVPDNVPAHTINRFCSSGLQAIATAANAVLAGQCEIVLAGGVESMSFVPMGGNVYHPDPGLMVDNPNVYISMGHTAERVAEKYGVTRDMQDEFSALSHNKAERAISEGKFDDEIIPIETIQPNADENGNPGVYKVLFKMDEGVRKNMTKDALAKLNPVFKSGGTVTAGNASQMSDGAAFVLVMSKEKAEALNINPIARFIGFSVAGVAPEVMGIGPIEAIPKVLKLANMTLSQIDLIELNEAFAAQAIACINTLGLNKEIVNVNGGAIALGHPLGCTGTYLTIKLIHEMKRRNNRYGLVSMCIGGGMGAAGLFEVYR
ncbi:MAG TPA: acetyl-CoA C-acyltransferase [Clostridiales bacterium]|jgi:acetyl-CoA acyltransferase|nr:acetyl-CoA C-acyltransferase [Clostridiales bacterium]